jgi:cation diffusion facilitator CzcD-associated flavoprotein CzcO
MHASPSVAIIGAGFGGIAAAFKAQRAGIRDIVILDRAERVGGVWQANTYPGAACDVPSHLYSLSFAPNPRWSRRFSPQPEIREYLEQVVADFGLRPLLRLGHDVTRAVWDEDTGRWHLEVEGGEDVEADVLIPACGQLTRPSIPDLPGLGSFAGEAFHSAWWDHDADLTGRRVAVVGTGASAIQFVPAIAERTAHIDVFQRSAPWTLPKPDALYGGPAQRLYERSPAMQRAVRTGWRGLMETLTPLFTGRPPLLARGTNAVMTGISELQRRVQLRDDPALREAARPDYVMGCKRVLITSDWLRALARPDVDLVTTPIDEVVPEGLRTADGRVHEADVLIFGTGFTATEFLAPLEVVGRGGASLRATWAGGAQAYFGMTVPRFPNMFVMYGPNTGHGTGSAIDMLEAQAGYVAQALGLLARGDAERLEVREHVHDAFQRELEERMRTTVWASGCGSWYVNDAGRVTATWPGPPGEYLRRTATLNVADYEPRRVAEPVAAA